MKGHGSASLKPEFALPAGFTDISTERRSPQISLLMQGCTRSSRDMRYPGCYLHLRTHGAENNNPKYKKTAQTWVEEGHGEYNGTCRVLGLSTVSSSDGKAGGRQHQYAQLALDSLPRRM
ncbi:hypothetical protein QL093DRAFT_2225943 [Fusarium oxysporum]|nr:hypothetical protein QL093DRAFT_2225943 [Fusarium oxysporum]